MENLTVNLDTAKKLKVAGFPQPPIAGREYPTACIWYRHLDMYPLDPGQKRWEIKTGDERNKGFGQMLAAPTAQELAEHLPKAIGRRFLNVCYPATLWLAGYTSNIEADLVKDYATGDTMAEALASLWLKLHETATPNPQEKNHE